MVNIYNPDYKGMEVEIDESSAFYEDTLYENELQNIFNKTNIPFTTISKYYCAPK